MACAVGPPQHFLYFAPERQGQGAFRGILLLTADSVELRLQNEVAVLGAGAGGVGAGAAGLQNESKPDSRKRWASWLSERTIKASIWPGAWRGGGCGGGVLVGELFQDRSAFLQIAEFGEGSQEDQMGLGSGAVHGFLLFFGAFVDHGVDVEIFDEAECFFYQAAATETPGSSHDFGGEGLLDGVFGG
jgi:hypothetical protein